jgi:hypothetical protein
MDHICRSPCPASCLLLYIRRHDMCANAGLVTKRCLPNTSSPCQNISEVCLPSRSAARWLDCRCPRDVHIFMHRLFRRYAAPAADATRQGGRLAFHLLARKDSELKPSAGTQRSATRDTIRVVHMLYAAPRFTGKRVDHRSDSQQATFSDVGCVYEFLLFLRTTTKALLLMLRPNSSHALPATQLPTAVP